MKFSEYINEKRRTISPLKFVHVVSVLFYLTILFMMMAMWTGRPISFEIMLSPEAHGDRDYCMEQIAEIEKRIDLVEEALRSEIQYYRELNGIMFESVRRMK